jgi:flagellar motility protein MotE (MotC chaperone)
MLSLPDPQHSRAVLVGVSSYAQLEALDAVRNNLADLAAELSAEDVWGLPIGNCAVVAEPNSPTEMLDPLTAAAKAATDTLLFYYSGHGLTPSTGGNLYLALPGSVAGRMYTSVPYDQVREALLNSRAVRKIVILDCCYSGLALGQMGDPASIVVNEASAEGTFVLAAAAENRTAVAPPGSRNTAFTAELLEAMRHGIPDAGPFLDLDSIYQQLTQSLRAKGLPVPQKRERNTGGQVTLIRNQAFHEPVARHLVLLDIDNLAAALFARFSDAGQRDRHVRAALRGILTDIARSGEVQGFASKRAPTTPVANEVAREVGIPVTLVEKPGNSAARAPVDVVMTAAAIDALPSISSLTLVTGDSDYVTVIEQARMRGVETTVTCLPEALSSALAAVADHVVPLALADPAHEPAAETSATVPAETAEPDVTDQELADELSRLKSASDAAFVLDALDVAQAVSVLELMDVKAASGALSKINPSRLAEVGHQMDLDHLARLLNELWSGDQSRLLGLIGEDVVLRVLPILPGSSAPRAIASMDPKMAVALLAKLNPDDVGKVLWLRQGASISPDPLDTILDYLHPDQVADYLSRIDPRRALKLLEPRGQDKADRFFDQLEPETAASVLNRMKDDDAAAWLGRADPDRIAQVLEHVSPKVAVEALNRLDEQRTELLLSRMRPVQSKLLKIAMHRIY